MPADESGSPAATRSSTCAASIFEKMHYDPSRSEAIPPIPSDPSDPSDPFDPSRYL